MGAIFGAPCAEDTPIVTQETGVTPEEDAPRSQQDTTEQNTKEGATEARTPPPTTTTGTTTHVTNQYITNPTTVIREVVQETVRESGGSGSSLDTSNFVTKDLFYAQTDSTHDSITDSTSGLSRGLSESVETDLLTVSGNGTITGTLTLNGVAYTFPAEDGSNGQALTTDGSGTLSWSTVSGGGGGSDTQWERFNDAGVRLATTSDQVLVGASATSSTAAFEVSGQSYFSGNVGIGTTSPWKMLSVNGDLSVTGAFFDSVNDTAGTSGMVLQTTGAGTQWVATSTLGINTDVAWGDITGTLSNQTDLQNALDGKIAVGTTSVDSITTLANLSITESQISDLSHYTSADFDTDFSGKSTTDLSEGTNLYYTDNRVASYISGSSTILKTNTESGLESFLTDVSNLFTSNDGALSDDDITDDSIEDLSDVASFTQSSGDVLYWNGGSWTNTATTTWDTQLTENQVEGFIFDADAETILADWDNTANPWADNEVSDALTISSSGSIADGALSANVSLLGSAINATELASEDFGDWTCNGTTCSLDSGTVASAEIADGSITEADFNLNAPTNDYLLVASSTAVGGFEWVATSTARLGLSSGAGAFTSSGGFTTLTTTSDNVGIGTSSPYARLSVVGETVSEFFTATSTTATSTFSGGILTGSGQFSSDVADSASAVAYNFDTENDLSTSGAKLFSFKNNGTDKFYGERVGNSAYDYTFEGYTSGQIKLQVGSNPKIISDGSLSFDANSFTFTGLGRNFEITGGNYFTRFGSASQASAFQIDMNASSFGDAAPNTSYWHAANAGINASTNIVGGDLQFKAGDGAANSAGAAHGGDVFIAGGFGYGTGNHGNVILTATSSSSQFIGNVGIGTTSPYAKLSVVGETVSEFFTATSTTATTTLAGGLNVGSGGLVYDHQTGNVGIGTTSPEARLEAKGSTSDNSAFAFKVLNSSGTKLVHIRNDGDMEFDASVSGTSFKVLGDANFGSATNRVVLGGGLGAGDKGVYLSYGEPWGLDVGILAAEHQGTSVKSLAINPWGGNVGIGTTDPDQPLHVVGSGTSGIRISDGDTTSDDASLRITGRQSSHGVIGVDAARIIGPTNRSITVEIDGNGSEDRFSVLTDPSDGGSADTEQFSVRNDGDVCGPDADLSNCSSDERLKQDITTLSYSIDQLTALNPVSFYWNDTAVAEYGYSTTSQQVGFVAQEVEQVIPEWVTTKDDGYKKVDDGMLKYALLQGFKQNASILDVNGATTSAPTLRSVFQGTTSPAIYIDEQGNVGIGENPEAYGASTSTLEHALTVDGDVAATGFVNVSSRDFKKDIEKLTVSSEDAATTTPFLDTLADLSIYSYRYISDSATSSERIGLLAEGAPPEILARDGRGIDLYQLITFIAGSMKELYAQFTELKEKVAGFAERFVTDELVFENAQGQNASVEQLCVGDVCVTEEEFKEVFSESGTQATSGGGATASAEEGANGGGSEHVESPAEPPITHETGDVSSTDGRTTTDNTDSASSTAGDAMATTTEETADTTPPEITLEGDAAIELTEGDPYPEPGYTATDDSDGDITVEVAIGGDAVDSSTSGTYTVTYNVTDAAGNDAEEKTRTVTVLESQEPVDDNTDEGESGESSDDSDGGGGGDSGSENESGDEA